MKILLIGADGQLGTDLRKTLELKDLIPLTLKDLDITNQEQVHEVIEKNKPEIVINTAAFHRTDDCEDQVDKAFLVNAIAVKYLADACKKNMAVLVHFSTDYVFDGEKGTPFLEADPPSPGSVYGFSKLAGEQLIAYSLKNYFIIRSSGLYGVAGCLGKGGGNFVEGMLAKAKAGEEIKVVNDEVLTPTYTLDLAKKVAQLVRTKNYGLYHITNQGETSWFDFTKKIFELTGTRAKVMPVTGEEFKSKIKRPKYSVLKNEHLALLGLDDLRPWEQALEAYLKEKGQI